MIRQSNRKHFPDSSVILFDRRTDGCSVDRMIDWQILFYCMIYLPMGRLIVWLVDWVDWLLIFELIDWLVRCMALDPLLFYGPHRRNVPMYQNNPQMVRKQEVTFPSKVPINSSKWQFKSLQHKQNMNWCVAMKLGASIHCSACDARGVNPFVNQIVQYDSFQSQLMMNHTVVRKKCKFRFTSLIWEKHVNLPDVVGHKQNKRYTACHYVIRKLIQSKNITITAYRLQTCRISTFKSQRR